MKYITKLLSIAIFAVNLTACTPMENNTPEQAKADLLTLSKWREGEVQFSALVFIMGADSEYILPDIKKLLEDMKSKATNTDNEDEFKTKSVAILERDAKKYKENLKVTHPDVKKLAEKSKLELDYIVASGVELFKGNEEQLEKEFNKAVKISEEIKAEGELLSKQYCGTEDAWRECGIWGDWNIRWH
ncbi:hypothetical protein [Actinobacillus equuli]|uniref:hypothetical protein n=1 Tax=Actinobacillus equuli TaxID=718 RepID=UPI002441971C|nr:hypothetical protein [Actinobacillus equuli]WGE74585.1 hypothetical protein NYR81_06130 [Actinobacillus equuli subsp. haemolyticus]WGE77652.1 hypothetical protein NYR82_01865 [Actinobacillus equuli subsp. haemolyticus]